MEDRSVAETMEAKHPPWRVWLQEHKFKLHLFTLLLMVVVHPVSEGIHDVRDLIEVFFVFVVISGTFAVDRTPARLAGALILAFLAALATGAFHITEWVAPNTNRLAAIFQLVTYIAFLLFAAALILNDVMHERRVGTDTICGAISVYLLIGISWALAYCLLEVIEPESFEFPARFQPDEGVPRAWEFVSTFIYFSFTTLTTLGFGDMTPISAAARTGTWLEAVCGQLYLAVLVARLVALRVANHPHHHPEPPAART